MRKPKAKLPWGKGALLLVIHGVVLTLFVILLGLLVFLFILLCVCFRCKLSTKLSLSLGCLLILLSYFLYVRTSLSLFWFVSHTYHLRNYNFSNLKNVIPHL